jgi:hypothetical protein
MSISCGVGRSEPKLFAAGMASAISRVMAPVNAGP